MRRQIRRPHYHRGSCGQRRQHYQARATASAQVPVAQNLLSCPPLSNIGDTQQPGISQSTSNTPTTSSTRTKQTARYTGPPRGGMRGGYVYRPGNIPSHARASEKASQDAKRVSACASFIPYEEPRFSFAEVCSFTHVGGWDPSRLLCPGVVGVAGGVYFAPRDAHLQTITTLPTLCNALAFVSFVDSAAITDGGVKDLITYCPNLKVLSFINAINLTDASFEVAVTQLASLEILRITGRTPFNPNSPSGKLTTKGSIGLLREQELGQTNKLGKKLKKLDLTGQAGISLVACRKLSGERNGLEIEVADVGPLVCTFWQGHLVGVENNPAFKPRGPGSQLLIGSEEGDQYSDNEDEMYDNFHTHDIFAGATLDPTTGLLMPPNGEYWEWNFVGV